MSGYAETGELDETQKFALDSVLKSEGGRVLLEVLVDMERAAINALTIERDEINLRRAQGRLKAVRSLLELCSATERYVQEKEPAIG